MPEFYVLTDVHLYGMKESDWLALSRRNDTTTIRNNRTSLIINEARFVPDPLDDEEALGRYQRAVSGRLFSAEWDGFRGHFVLKIPRRDIDDEDNAVALAALESEKADPLQSFGTVVPQPLGHATVKFDDDGGVARHVFCNIQGRVEGETLQSIFFNVHGNVDKPRLREFLRRRDDGTCWSLCPPDEHVPFVLVIEHILLPLAQKLYALEDQKFQHGDISPANIMWSDTLNDFRLVDLALMSKYGTVDNPVPLLGEGTAPYAPPAGNDAGERLVRRGTDIRSLCALCWQLLGFPLPLDATATERAESIKSALGPDSFGSGFLSIVAKEASEEAVAYPVATIAQLGKQIQAAEEYWRDELREIILGEGECGGMGAHDVYNRFHEEVRNLKNNIRHELKKSQSKSEAPADKIALGIVVGLAFSATLGAMLLLPPLGSLIVGAAQSHAFLPLSVSIALAPIALGTFVDSPLAWWSFKRSHPEVRFDWRSFQLVAKYGSLDGIARGAGRFDPTASHCLYFGLCNFTGMLCYVSLLLATMSIDGFSTFIMDDPNLPRLAIFVPMLSAAAAWATVVSQQKMPPMVGQRRDKENPDIHSFTHVHVWANMLHLTWTFSWVIILCFELLVFCITAGRTIASPAALIWPCLQFALFATFAGVSPRAQSIEAEAFGYLLWYELPILALVAFLIGFVLFLPSAASLCYAIVAAVSLAALAWIRRFMKGDKTRSSGDGPHADQHDKVIWMDRTRRNGVFIVVIALVILGLGIASWAIASKGL